MSNLPDPILLVHRRTTAARVIALPTLALCAVWALWPLGQTELCPPQIVPPAPPARDESGPAPLNLAVFDASLWGVPPQPIVKVPEPAPPPEVPMRLRIIGIIHEQREGADVALAVLYDPDSDRLIFAERGEKIGRHTVGSISDSGVELTSGRSHQTLLLDERAKPTKRGGGT